MHGFSAASRAVSGSAASGRSTNTNSDAGSARAASCHRGGTELLSPLLQDNADPPDRVLHAVAGVLRAAAVAAAVAAAGPASVMSMGVGAGPGLPAGSCVAAAGPAAAAAVTFAPAAAD